MNSGERKKSFILIFLVVLVLFIVVVGIFFGSYYSLIMNRINGVINASSFSVDFKMLDGYCDDFVQLDSDNCAKLGFVWHNSDSNMKIINNISNSDNSFIAFEVKPVDSETYYELYLDDLKFLGGIKDNDIAITVMRDGKYVYGSDKFGVNLNGLAKGDKGFLLHSDVISKGDSNIYVIRFYISNNYFPLVKFSLENENNYAVVEEESFDFKINIEAFQLD